MTTDDRAFLRLWQWLMSVLALSLLVALTLLFLPTTALYAGYNATYARAFWGLETLPPEALRQHHFTVAVVGAGVIGWVVNLAWVAAVPLKRREPWAWWCCAVSVASWVVVDVGVCLWFRVWGELLFVSAAALGFGVPLAGLYPFFSRARAGSPALAT